MTLSFRFHFMRTIISIILIGFFQHFGYSQYNSGCKPTINIETSVFPNKIDLGFACPAGTCCYTHIKAKDKRFDIIEFTLLAYKICKYEDDVFEFKNTGNSFSPAAKSIINRACKGSILEFTCIKAIDTTGKIYILQPFSVELK